MIKAILFDWHGVLDRRTFGGMLEKIAEAWYPLFAPTRRERKETSFETYKQIIKENWRKEGVEYALGILPPKYFWLTLESEEETGVETAKRYLLTVEKNEELWQLLPKLKEEYSLAILSDCPSDKAQVIRQTCDLSYFQQVYFSCEYGIGKHDREFFEMTIRDLNMKPQECLFVDDAEYNIVFAQSLGFQICHYKTKEDLERQFFHHL